MIKIEILDLEVLIVQGTVLILTTYHCIQLLWNTIRSR